MSEEPLDTSTFVSGEMENGVAPAEAPQTSDPAPEAADPDAEAAETEQVEGEEDQPQPKPKKTAQERIDELTRARREAERDRGRAARKAKVGTRGKWKLMASNREWWKAFSSASRSIR